MQSVCSVYVGDLQYATLTNNSTKTMICSYFLVFYHSLFVEVVQWKGDSVCVLLDIGYIGVGSLTLSRLGHITINLTVKDEPRK